VKVALLNLTTTTQMGGVESFVWELAARLPAHRIQVDVLGGHGPITRDLPPMASVKTFAHISRAHLARIPLLNRSASLIKFLERIFFAFAALPFLLRTRYDILHIQKPYDLPLGLLAKFLTGGKLLFGCHGTDYFVGDRFFARFADGAVSCSRFNASQIMEHYHLAPIVVFNGFEPRLFSPRPRDENLRVQYAAPFEYLILYAGRLIRWKGVNYLLDALTCLDANVRLLVAGEGEERARLELQARAMGIEGRVFFLGRVAQADLPEIYRASDLVVLPSLAHETFSIVACEALACERAVVGTNVGGIPELVQELVPPGDAEALANKIRMLLANPTRRSEIARHGREQVFSYLTWDATTARVVQVYQRLMRGEKVFASNHSASGVTTNGRK
jgi:D-inositol-3-phosphate glycosyltransferase